MIISHTNERGKIRVIFTYGEDEKTGVIYVDNIKKADKVIEDFISGQVPVVEVDEREELKEILESYPKEMVRDIVNNLK